VRAIQITRFGGPEVLAVRELPDPVPAPGHLLVEVTRAGVNYADTHQTDNTYLAPVRLPLVPGVEIAGCTPEGRRVVALVSGGYAERATAAPSLAFDVPDEVTDGQALALVTQGTTAWHLLRTCSRLAAGESVVVHAAAGGVGTLAVQLARLWGAGRVIATASSDDKRQLALELGADIAVDPRPDGLTERLVEANGGRQVDIVLEMAGGPVFDASLAALAPFGRLVVYGMASRSEPQPLSAGALLTHSHTLTGFWLRHCFARPALLSGPLDELFAWTAKGDLRPVLGGEYGLSEARRAHEDLLARRTTGKLLLDPAH
jgi:NADPH2:quinone reductase